MSVLGSYAGNVLRVDLTRGKIAKEPLDIGVARMFLGGRGLNSKILYDEVPRSLDPMSPENRLIFAAGPLVGTFTPCASRFTVTTKSPLTGILGDANAGGHFGSELKYASYDQVIIQGRSEKPVYLWIDDDAVELRDAEDLWGIDVWDTTDRIREELCDGSIQVACIGPAGERGVLLANILVNHVRAASRSGIGAVMGLKRLKAVAVRGSGSLEVAHNERFMEAVREVEENIRNIPGIEERRQMGTPRLVNLLNEMGILVTRHFQTGYFPNAEKISGERLAREFNVKSKACFACPVGCSRFYVVPQGRFRGLHGEGPEYETVASFGSKLDNDDLGAVLKANEMVNRLGLDSIGVGEVIAFAMELHQRGLLSKGETDMLDLSWGNVDTILSLIEKIAYRKGFGDLLSLGVREAARRIGRGSEKYAMHVKGQAIICGEPRGIKGYGLTYAVASRGADHLRAEPFFELKDDPEIGLKYFGMPDAGLRLAYKGKGKVVKYTENWCALVDAMGVCKNIMVCEMAMPFDLAARLLSAAIGWDLTEADVVDIGSRIINLERCFNVREGLTRKDDVLPDRFTVEPLPPECRSSAGQVVELEPMLDEFYRERGWDVKTGIPTRSTLKRLGLVHAANELARLGRLPSEEIVQSK